MLTGFIAFLILPDSNKYKSTLKDYRSDPKTVITYFDLDGDGISEEIRFHNSDLYHYVMVYVNSTILEDWYLDGLIGNFGFADYNRDGSFEIYVNTYYNDSIFINQINPWSRHSDSTRSKYVDRYTEYSGKIEKSGQFEGAVDLNADGTNDIIFSFLAGQSQKPRKIAAWDIYNDTLFTSEYSGTGILGLEFFDGNHDGFLEIFGKTAAFENCKKDFPYPDTMAWLMVLDHDLKFLFDPIPLGGKTSSLQYLPVKGGSDYIIALLKNEATGASSSEILLFDMTGVQINNRPLIDRSPGCDFFLLASQVADENFHYLITSEGTVEIINNKLEIIKKIRVQPFAGATPRKIDIDLDGTNELIFQTRIYDEFIIYRDGFRHPVKIKLPHGGSIQNYSINMYEGNKHFLCFYSEGYLMQFDYLQNDLYYWRYLIYIIIFTLIFLIIRFYFRYLSNLKFINRTKITELQIKSISNQLEPHFTLNTLNAIGSLYAHDDKDKADFYFAKYAKLVRNTLIHSEQISHSLNEELEYVKNYLDIQKFRFNERFDYTVSVSEEINLDLTVPKMLLFTFVENAVKHGLRNKEGKGHLIISIESSEKKYRMTIGDDGIGREKAKEYSGMSTGKGLRILDEILDLYNKLYRQRIIYTIKDQYDNTGKSAGTMVIVELPIKSI